MKMGTSIVETNLIEEFELTYSIFPKLIIIIDISSLLLKTLFLHAAAALKGLGADGFGFGRQEKTFHAGAYGLAFIT